MNSRILMAAIVAGFALSACAPMQPAPARSPPVGAPSGCPGSGAECNVYIDVTDCTHVIFDPDALAVNGGARVIHWRIRLGEGSYAFAPTGIIIKDPDPGQEFHGGGRVEHDRGYVLNDRNSVARTYRYGVDLMHGSEACPRFDPTIVNQR